MKPKECMAVEVVAGDVYVVLAGIWDAGEDNIPVNLAPQNR